MNSRDRKFINQEHEILEFLSRDTSRGFTDLDIHMQTDIARLLDIILVLEELVSKGCINKVITGKYLMTGAGLSKFYEYERELNSLNNKNCEEE